MQLTKQIAIVALSAVALLAADAAHAGYGYGGGGGNQPKPKRKPKPKANVVAKVKDGDLVLKGSAGSLFVRITPTPDGLLVASRNGATKINGGDEPFVAQGVTGAWKLKFGRALAIELDIGAPEGGAPRPRADKVSFTGGKRADLHLQELDVAGDLLVDVRRTLSRRAGTVTLGDCVVGGDVRLRGASDRTRLAPSSCTIGGELSFDVRVRSRSSRYVASLEVANSSVGSVRVVVGRGNGELQIDESTVDGSVSARGDVNVIIDNSAVAGDLTVASSFDAQSVFLARTDIGGTARISTGARDDDILVSECAIGLLDLRAGAGNDVLDTEDLSVGPGSRYDASRGRADAWYTEGDGSELELVGVEHVGPHPGR